jgi:predicted MFS family arabinose efflux permease
LARLKNLLALNRNLAVLLGAIILINSGEELWMRFLPKYLEVLGASAFVIGLFDAIKTVLGAVYAYPGGVVVDRWGHRLALAAFTMISIAGYLLVLATQSVAGVLIGMFLFLAWTNLSLPATFSLVAASLPATQHAMGIGVQSLIRRLPVLIGPVAGGLLIDRLGMSNGIAAGIGLTIALAGGSIFLHRAIRDEPVERPVARKRLWTVVRDFDPDLRRLLVSDILIRFCERIPFAWVIIFAMDVPGVSATKAGVLVALEMTAAMLCYIPASWLADRYGKEPFVIVTFVMFTLFPLSLLVADSFVMLAIAFVIRGLKEFGEPARKSLIIGYAPGATRGQTIGAYYLVRDTVVSAGSFLGATLWRVSPAINFSFAAATGVAGTVLYALAVRRRERLAG